MISYFTGVPGSGKSYFAVDTIYNNFSVDDKAKKTLKKQYTNCYSNINGLKYDDIKNVNKLDFDLLYKCLERLHRHYKAKKDDAYLIKLSKRYKINNTLFVIDEAHNHFDVQKPVLVWWLTYHRHLYHDIMLITQNLALINAKYKPLAEAFYKAVPKTLSLNPLKFTYKMYTEKSMSKVSEGGKVSLKKRKEVFALYHSGDSVEAKNIILKFLVIALVIFGTLGTLIYFISSSSESNIKVKEYTKEETKKELQQTNDNERTIYNEIEDLRYIEINCKDDLCNYKDINFHINLLLYFSKDNYLEVIGTTKTFKKNTIDLVLDKSFLTLIKGEQDEDNNNNNSSVSQSLGI